MEMSHEMQWGDGPNHGTPLGASEFATRVLNALDALPLEALHGMPLECDGASQALSQA